MWKTVLRRVLIMIPEIIILSVFVFILAKMMPGDPFTGSITPQTSPARIHELKVQAGLYDPWYVQYGRWITNLFHGDLGISYQFKTPVAGLIASRAGNTLWLSLVIVVLSYLFAIPLGIIAGRFENSKSDRVIQLYNYISYAIPGFVFYLLGLWLWLRFGYFSDIRFRFHRSRQRLWLRYESNISHDFASFACGAHFNHKYLSVSAKRNHRFEDAGLRENGPCQGCS